MRVDDRESVAFRYKLYQFGAGRCNSRVGTCAHAVSPDDCRRREEKENRYKRTLETQKTPPSIDSTGFLLTAY